MTGLRRWVRWWLTPSYCRPEARHEMPPATWRLGTYRYTLADYGLDELHAATEAQPLTIDDVERMLDVVANQRSEPHHHVVNPRGGSCECGVYISAEMLRRAGFRVPPPATEETSR